MKTKLLACMFWGEEREKRNGNFHLRGHGRDRRGNKDYLILKSKAQTSRVIGMHSFIGSKPSFSITDI